MFWLFSSFSLFKGLKNKHQSPTPDACPPIPKFNPAATIPTSPILSSVFASRSSTGIGNIPSPVTSLRSSLNSTASPSQAPEVEMTDAAPEPAIPTPPTTPRPDSERDIPIQSMPSGRPILQPVRQHNRHLPSRPKRDISAEVVMEEDDGALPKGYCGTYNGMRFYKPEDTTPLHGCRGSHHEIACGHWIYDAPILSDERSKPCGLNCTKPNYDVAAFNCPQCHDAIMNVLNNKLTNAERAKLEHARKEDHKLFIVGYITEFVAKYTDLRTNITESVIAILNNEYGRKCRKALAPEPIKYYTPQEFAQEMEDHRAAKEFAKNNKLNNPGKRKYNLSPSSQDQQSKEQATTTVPQEQNKKQKTKLETHKEAITTSTRGRKRTTTFNDYFHPQRKRVFTTPPIQYGEVSYITPSPNVVGPIIRKRDSDAILTTSIDAEALNRQARKFQKLSGENGPSDANDIPRWDARCEDEGWEGDIFAKSRQNLPTQFEDDEELCE